MWRLQGRTTRRLILQSPLASLLRKRRASQKMSQDALAAKSGYERAFISLIERGKTNPSLRSIFDICTALDIRPSVFLRQVEKAANFDLPA